jgi:hypothetical protein
LLLKKHGLREKKNPNREKHSIFQWNKPLSISPFNKIKKSDTFSHQAFEVRKPGEKSGLFFEGKKKFNWSDGPTLNFRVTDGEDFRSNPHSRSKHIGHTTRTTAELTEIGTVSSYIIMRTNESQGNGISMVHTS